MCYTYITLDIILWNSELWKSNIVAQVTYILYTLLMKWNNEYNNKQWLKWGWLKLCRYILIANL